MKSRAQSTAPHTRATTALLAVLALLFVATPAAAVRPSHAEPLTEFLLVLESDDPADAWRVTDALAAQGCDGFALHGAGVLEGLAPARALGALGRAQGVRLALTGPADAALLGTVTPATRARLEMWNYHLEVAAVERAKADAGAADVAATMIDQGACVVLQPPASIVAERAKTSADLARLPKYNQAWGAEDYQTSEFFFGRIAVAIVTPRTASQVWSREDLLATHDAVREAFNYWKAQAANSYVPVYLAFEYVDSVLTEKSPLTSAEDQGWTQPLMNAVKKRLGMIDTPKAAIPDQGSPEAYAILNHLRKRYTADWAVMVIVGQGNRFSDAPGLGAYAYLGGPYLVTPNKPSRYDLTGLVIHESGHLFYALDEYCCGGTSSPCSDKSGYLNVANQNSLNRDGGCASNSVPCAMASPSKRSCKYTEGMMGIQDTDTDGIYDLFDTHAVVQVELRDGLALIDSVGRRALDDTIRTLTPTFVGYGHETPLQNLIARSGTGAADDAPSSDRNAASAPQRPRVTMNTVTSIDYRIDEGPWRFVRPDSSGYDAPVEDFRVTPEGLSGGAHTIEFRGTNSVGNVTEGRFTRKERVVVLAIALEDLALTNELDGAVTAQWRVRGESWDTTGRLFRSGGGETDVLLAERAQSDNGLITFTDRMVKPGKRYTYRVESAAFGKTYSVTADAVASVPIREANGRISSASPNPFSTETYLSFLVPEGRIAPPAPDDDGRKPGPPPIRPAAPHVGMSDAGTAAPAQERLSVVVNVTIHDASGRVVRTLVADALPGLRLYTVAWDGKNDSGNALPPGVYFSRFSSGTYVDTNKLVLLR